MADDVPGVKFNLPTLTKSMGFTSTKAQLLSVPPYILASITCVLIPHLSDRYGARAACKSIDCRMQYANPPPSFVTDYMRNILRTKYLSHNTVLLRHGPRLRRRHVLRR